VVCHKCSGQKFPLIFEENKTSRVCKACFQLLHLHAKKDASKAEEADQLDNSGSNPENPAAVLGGRDFVDAPVSQCDI
jgi:hypothetical protein